MASARDNGVFFPWERRRGWFGGVIRTRARLVLGALLAFTVLYALHRREEGAAAVRSTRASIADVMRAVASYRADHKGACPAQLADLVTGGYTRDVPLDAWGHPFRLTCPGRLDEKGFDVVSDGPDGIPGGLDRVE